MFKKYSHYIDSISLNLKGLDCRDQILNKLNNEKNYLNTNDFSSNTSQSHICSKRAVLTMNIFLMFCRSSAKSELFGVKFKRDSGLI